MNFLFGARITATDPVEAKEALDGFRAYPLAKDGEPLLPVLEAADRPWTGTPPRGLAYWAALHPILHEEPLGARGQFFPEMLKPLGIERGEPFVPDARQKELLEQGALVGNG